MLCQDLEIKKLIKKRLRLYFVTNFNIDFKYSEEENKIA